MPKLITASRHFHVYELFTIVNQYNALKKYILIETNFHIILTNAQKYCSPVEETTPRFIQLTTFYLGIPFQRVRKTGVSNIQSQQLPKDLIIGNPTM
jgi:hypothetical protein